MSNFAIKPTGNITEVHADTRKRDAGFLMEGHHCHTFYELFYVHSGKCRHLIEDRFYDLRAGDLILIPPMVLHYTRYIFGSCIRTVVLFRPEDITEETLRFLRSAGRASRDTTRYRVPPAAMDQVDNCLEQMTAEDRIDDEYTTLLRRAYLQSFLLLCCRICEVPDDEDPEEIRTNDRQILRAARYINENYMNTITTEDVARAVSFSPNYLSRRFRTEAGIGLHEYIVFVRLHHAAQQLLSSPDSITAIALRCGFSNSNYFKDSFKKKYGVTPRTYRNRR